MNYVCHISTPIPTMFSQTIGAISFSPTTLTVGGSTTASANATSGLAVSFISTPTTSVCIVSGSTVTGIAAGTCTIAADQSGNATYNPAPQVTQNITVSAAPVVMLNQTISFGTAPAIVAGGTGIVSATASSGLAVTYTSTTLGGCTISGGTITGIAAGTCTIAANQAGNASYNAATQVTQSITIGAVVTSPICTLTASSPSISASGTSLLTASCTPVAASYAWSANTGFGSTVAMGSVSPSVTTTYSVSGSNAGGTGNTSISTVTVTPPPTPICTLTASPTSISAGGSSILTASCTPAATSYDWIGGTCASTSATSCTVSPSATTTYTVTGSNATGSSTLSSVTVTVAPIASVSVIEFYNTNLDNYFITANSSEAAAIDSGGAGPGWSRTGNSFKSGGDTSVCRFYGSQSPGPNSHFYTVNPGECDSLKQQQASTPATQKRWNYESLDFVSTPPTKGTCPSGTVPVYRAYNNGYARGVDSNHRITSSTTAIQEVVTRGWSNEGVTMCAPI